MQHFGVCRCACTVVDVGLNNGQTLSTWLPTVLSRTVVERAWKSGKVPHGVTPRWSVPPESPRRPALERCASAPTTCLYGFEANPNFDDALAATERRMRRHGAERIKIFNSTAFALEDGHAHFYVDHQPAATGSTLSADKSLAEQLPHRPKSWRFQRDVEVATKYRRVRVPTVSAARFLAGVAAFSDTVAVKIDIEGFEYRLFQSLLTTAPASLCSLDLLALEWHEVFMLDKRSSGGVRSAADPRPSDPLPANATRALEWLLSAPECGVTLLNLWRAPEASG